MARKNKISVSLKSFPEYKFNEQRSNQALEGIYSTIVLRDIPERNSQADNAVLQKLMRFLCSGIGSVTSPNNIGSVLYDEGNIDGRGRKMAGKTVEKYLDKIILSTDQIPINSYDGIKTLNIIEWLLK